MQKAKVVFKMLLLFFSNTDAKNRTGSFSVHKLKIHNIYSTEVLMMKTIYIEKMDKPKWNVKKIIIKGDSLKINIDLEKDKNIKKAINKLIKN